jgi:hypothetical protein
MGNNLALIDPTKPESAAWRGALRMVSVHKRALNAEQIMKNFNVPPGEKRYVMFNVSQLNNMPASCRGTDTAGQTVSYCYIYFEISQYDNYAYLFNKPYFISLNNDISDLNGLEIKGIRIGLNGKLSPVGQAYVHVDSVIDTSKYTAGMAPGSGQLLSSIGTVVPKSSGADSDLLYLEFDKIGANADQTPAPTVLSFAYTLDGIPAIDLGWRTFDAVSASFSQLTGVLVTDSTGFTDAQGAVTVARVFSSVRQQLPAVENFSAYLSSHQTGVTQLAIAYCSALMQNDSRRQAFFTNATPTDFRNNLQGNLIDPLVNRFMGSPALLASHDTTVVKAELLELITNAGSAAHKPGLCPGGSCSDPRTLQAGTAACAAALANAALILQ